MVASCGGARMSARRCVVSVSVAVVLSVALVGQAQQSTKIDGVVVSFDDAFGSVVTDIGQEDLNALGVELGDWVEVTLSGHTLEMPVVSDMFPYLPQSLPGLIVWGNAYIVGWYANIAETYGVALGDEVEARLLEKGGYLPEMAVRDVDRVKTRGECEEDAEYANFREIVCGDVARGVLFRSSHPADGSDRSHYAHSLMVAAHIRKMINVGASWNDPRQAFDNSEYYSDCGDSGSVLATDIGLAVAWDHFKRQVAEALRFMIGNEPPYLIHCRIGQDRTGIAIAILEAISGASLPDVINDYELTFQNYYRISHGHELYFEVVEQLLSELREMNGGRVVTSQNLQSVVKEHLINEVGLSESELALLHRRLVTGL
jgi:hypothetical protein